MAATAGRYPGPVYFVGFVGAMIVQAILATIAAVVTAVLAPSDASAGSDERDKAIARRSYAIAYPVLLVLVVCVAASIHFGARPVNMAYGIMGAIVIAEIVHYGAQIFSYRRGWHG
jgi:hypothetical protein